MRYLLHRRLVDVGNWPSQLQSPLELLNFGLLRPGCCKVLVAQPLHEAHNVMRAAVLCVSVLNLQHQEQANLKMRVMASGIKLWWHLLGIRASALCLSS